MASHPHHGEPADASAAARETTPDVVAVFVANHRDFLSFLERRVGNRAVAEDILQEAFVKGIGRVRADDDDSAVAWFYRTLRNAAVDYHRRHSTASKALESFAAESDDSFEPELRSAVCQCVGRLAETLKPEYADAIKRIDVEGISVKDYAAEAGISASNAGVRVFRAREALRGQVTRSCGTCAQHGCLDCSCGSPNKGARVSGHGHHGS
jgi:RNA polymerase sigma factor (sigma-70 family)